jgi:hypothetical protein
MPLFNRSERLQQAIIAAVVLVDVCLLWRGPMTIGAAEAFRTFAFGLAATAGGVYYRHWRSEEKLAMALIGLGNLIWFSCAIAVLNYLAVTFQRPLIDEQLYAWDQALHFDWQTVFTALKGTPVLGPLLSVAYNSSMIQIALIMPALALLGEVERLERFFLAFTLAAIATVLFWAAFPSFGAATYLFSTGTVGDLTGAEVDQDYVPRVACTEGRRSAAHFYFQSEGFDRFSILPYSYGGSGHVHRRADQVCALAGLDLERTCFAISPRRWRPSPGRRVCWRSARSLCVGRRKQDLCSADAAAWCSSRAARQQAAAAGNYWRLSLRAKRSIAEFAVTGAR